MHELQEVVSIGRQPARAPGLPPARATGADICLYEFEAYELWTFTHPNVDHIGRLGTFRIDEWPAAAMPSLLDVFRQSETKHSSHPGRHELATAGAPLRGYALDGLVPAGLPAGPQLRERFLTVRSERNTQPAGVARFIERLHETALPGGGRAVCLTFDFPFILVRPECRGLAFGAALARARGRACGETIEAITQQLAATPLTVRIRHGELHQLGARTLQASLEEMECAMERIRTRLPGNPLLLLEHIPCCPMDKESS